MAELVTPQKISPNDSNTTGLALRSHNSAIAVNMGLRKLSSRVVRMPTPRSKPSSRMYTRIAKAIRRARAAPARKPSHRITFQPRACRRSGFSAEPAAAIGRIARPASANAQHARRRPTCCAHTHQSDADQLRFILGRNPQGLSERQQREGNARHADRHRQQPPSAAATQQRDDQGRQRCAGDEQVCRAVTAVSPRLGKKPAAYALIAVSVAPDPIPKSPVAASSVA
jgi:hypothetical protein